MTFVENSNLLSESKVQFSAFPQKPERVEVTHLEVHLSFEEFLIVRRSRCDVVSGDDDIQLDE